jgi:uncharacterized RDD family membrane protein YckC
MPLEPPAEALESAVYASWGRRLLAFVVDYVAFAVLITVPLVIASDSSEDLQGWLYFLFWPAVVILMGAYFTVFHGGKRGQTPGKRLLGIAVRDASSHESIGYGRAFGRLLVFVLLLSFPVPVVSGILDGLWPLWDKKNQSLHDKVARSVVVREGSSSPTRTLAESRGIDIATPGRAPRHDAS